MRLKLPYRVVESKLIYQGHIVRLLKDRFVLDAVKDKVVTRELIEHPGAVAVIPFASPKEIVLLRQFRYSAQGDLWEIPAGTLEKNEKTAVCARRELEEETGFRARRWKRLTRFYPAPGITNEIMTIYRADSLYPGKKDLDHDEFIEHETVTIKKALDMIKKGRIRDGKSIIGILWAVHFS